MCDYCGCRSRPLVADLGADHGRIADLASVVRRALDDGDRPGARQALTELAHVLEPHAVLEEGSLYPELALEGIATKEMYADHAFVDSTIRDAVAGSSEAWAEVPSALSRLAGHIATEEYDLFPAAHQLLSDVAWDRVEQHHEAHHHHHPDRHGHS